MTISLLISGLIPSEAVNFRLADRPEVSVPVRGCLIRELL
jgi:hypothetical protein